MGKYDAIRGAGNVTVQAPPDFWTSAKQSFDDDYDRLVAAQERKKAEERYVKESTEEQNRYDTEQENIMFQQRQSSAENEYSKAMEEYKLAYEQIGKHNPEMMEKLQRQFGKEYKIPRQDGTFETRYVVPQSVREFTSSKVQSRKDLDDILDNWDTLSPSQKTAVWPKVKEINRYFTRDLSDYEASAKRAMSYEDNAKLLDTMGNFLPAGYDNKKWTAATELLLKDGEVSEAELKLVASDINANIANRKDAEKFWSEFSSNVMKARSDLKLDSDPTVIKDLQTMQETALSNLDIYYPGVSGRTSIDNSREETANKISQKLWGVDFEELTDPEKQKKVFEEFQKADAPIEGEEVVEGEKELDVIGSSFTPMEKVKKQRPPITPISKEKKPWIERMGFDEYGVQGDVPKFLLPEPPGRRGRNAVKDPVDLQYKGSKGIAIGVRLSPFTYANKGIIPSDKSPGYKKVSIKEALQHYQKNKSKYKKDKPITISTKGIWPFFQGRPDKDLTQYPE
jgi:hypothetical protein